MARAKREGSRSKRTVVGGGGGLLKHGQRVKMWSDANNKIAKLKREASFREGRPSRLKLANVLWTGSGDLPSLELELKLAKLIFEWKALPDIDAVDDLKKAEELILGQPKVVDSLKHYELLREHQRKGRRLALGVVLRVGARKAEKYWKGILNVKRGRANDVDGLQTCATWYFRYKQREPVSKIAEEAFPVEWSVPMSRRKRSRKNAVDKVRLGIGRYVKLRAKYLSRVDDRAS
ncbi:MAG: hypothetical protein ACYDA9_14090 [Terriglobia bacterium]